MARRRLGLCQLQRLVFHVEDLGLRDRLLAGLAGEDLRLQQRRLAELGLLPLDQLHRIHDLRLRQPVEYLTRRFALFSF